MGGLLHLVQRGGDWAGPQPAQPPPRCTKCNSPPINGQCTNHRIDVRCSALLMWPSRVNYLSRRIVLRSQTDTCSGWEPRRLRHVGTRTCRRLHTSEPHGTTRRHVPIIVEQSLSHTARTPPTAVRNIASLSPQKTHTRQTTACTPWTPT